MSIQGIPQLKARLKAAGQAFKPIGRDWVDEAVDLAGAAIRASGAVDTGELAGSFKRKQATAKRAIVVGRYTGYFVDAGVKPHSTLSRKARPKTKAGRTIFSTFTAKNHPGYRARPFRQKIAEEALRKHPMGDAVVKAWNEAA